jgi:hypothetical protein
LIPKNGSKSQFLSKKRSFEASPIRFQVLKRHFYTSNQPLAQWVRAQAAPENIAFPTTSTD